MFHYWLCQLLAWWVGRELLGAGQGEEEDQSEMDSGRLPTERVSADWAGWRGRKHRRVSAGVPGTKPRAVTGLGGHGEAIKHRLPG